MESSTTKKEINTVELSEKNSTSTSSKTQLNLDYTELINELSQINQDGDSLLKELKFEEAKIKYLQGYNKVENETEKSDILYTINPQLEEILSKYKIFLSKIAECFYKQKDYKNTIVYDLKLISLEPKDPKSIIRLFYSYSKLEKYQQAAYYGELFTELDKNTQEKFEDVQKDIDNEKDKLNYIFNKNNNRINVILFNFILISIILSLTIVFFKIYK